MKIKFDDGSYVEITRSIDKVKISLGSVKRIESSKVLTVTSSEVSIEQFTDLSNEILEFS